MTVPRLLTTARNYYLQQRRLAALTLRGARKAAPRGAGAVATQVAGYQTAAALLADTAVAKMLEEQAIEAPSIATLAPEAFSGATAAGARLVDYLSTAADIEQQVAMAVQQVRDAGRAAQGVAIVTRPNLAGYVRYLNPPSCGRCAVLAGKFYRYSKGFERHENCDCIMLPTNQAPSDDLITSPQEAFDKGLITDLTVAETQAILDGADVAKVVNIRRRGAGLTVAGRVLDRGGKPTPEGIYASTTDRDKIIALLTKHGYIT